MIKDCIFLRDFRPESRKGLLLWAEQFGYDLEQIGCLTQWAWLLFLMKHSPDNDDHFISGKWATIQFLEQMLNEAALGRIQNENT